MHDCPARLVSGKDFWRLSHAICLPGFRPGSAVAEENEEPDLLTVFYYFYYYCILWSELTDGMFLFFSSLALS